MPVETAPLSDDERHELEIFLERGGEKALPIESVDGLFAALICFPLVAKPDEWLPLVFGGELLEWGSARELERIIDLLLRHWNDVAASIEDGTFSPIFTTGVDASGTEVVLAHHWCMGFNEGMHMHQAQWFKPADDELKQLLHPIQRVFADALLIMSPSRPKRVKHLSFEEMNVLADAIPDAVIELSAYWQRHPIAAHPESERGVSARLDTHGAPDREKGTWIAGLADFPGFVEGATPYRPVMALVLDAGGLVLGASVKHPDERPAAIAEAVQAALNAPMAGDPERPDRVIVPARELIPLVGRVLPGAKILVGPTPELDEAFKTLRERIAVEGDEHEPATCLTADNNPQALASFFDAAAELYDRAPWTIVPDEESLLRITSSKLGIRGAVVCIIGQMKESYGVLLFNSHDDYRRYRRLAGLTMSGSKPTRGFPRHAALSFERAKDVASAQRKEIAAHKWRVAGPAAFPRIMLVEPDMVLRPPARTDYRRMEGVCRAISQLIDTEAELSKVLEGGGSMRRRVTVDVEGAPVSVTISVR